MQCTLTITLAFEAHDDVAARAKAQLELNQIRANTVTPKVEVSKVKLAEVYQSAAPRPIKL